jgi:CheY-specific phosphatase CheX
MQAHVADDDIAMIVEGIYTELLGIEIQRVAEAALGGHRRTVSGCVQITGAWEGAVTVECPEELAHRTAVAMFGGEPESGAEIADALGEVTNMAGGNIKALLPGPSQLSLPAVVEGSNQHVSVPGSSLLTEVAFECLGLPLKVTVVQRRADGEQA